MKQIVIGFLMVLCVAAIVAGLVILFMLAHVRIINQESMQIFTSLMRAEAMAWATAIFSFWVMIIASKIP